ncbi:MAG: hypothetical protein WC773_03840 [Patescibacteria group bacterium]
MLPWVFTENGQETTVAKCPAVTAVKGMVTILLPKARLICLDEAKVTGVWMRDMGKKLPSGTAFPDDRSLVALGKKLGVDYVMVGNCAWRMQSPWVERGPNSKVECAVSVRIVNVKTGVEAYKNTASTNSSRKEAPLTITRDMQISSMVINSGPKTPRMGLTGGFAAAKALNPWVSKFAGKK